MADTGGRVTMPFLPTLATVVVLAAASFLCPKGDVPAPGAAARMIPASGAATLAMSAPATPAAEPAPRPPAVIAFGEIFPLTADPSVTSALPAPSQTAAATQAPRPARRIASSVRRPCPGKRCQETAPHDAMAQDNPFRAARTASEEPSTPSAVPTALPFAESVVEAVVPVAREVGARVERISGSAGDLVRGGQAVVKGSVAVLTDRLF